MCYMGIYFVVNWHNYAERAYLTILAPRKKRDGKKCRHAF